MNLKHRKIYAPEILKEISNYLDAIESKEDLLPKSDLQVAVTYIRNEWSAIENLFTDGDTYLDNNQVYPNFIIIQTFHTSAFNSVA